MKKFLFLLAFLNLAMLTAKADGTITLTRESNYAKTAELTVEASGPVSVEGATGEFVNGKEFSLTYEENSNQIVLKGDFISFRCLSSSLGGIEFKGCDNLHLINCSENLFINSLDVSECPKLDSLFCYKNKISNLTLGEGKYLKWINCGDNKLANLDLSAYSELTDLFCFGNKDLAELVLPMGDHLRVISCFKCNLTELDDISSRKNLRVLSCFSNKLQSMDVTGCESLEILQVNNNRLTSLVLGENHQSLRQLLCHGNKLTEIDLKGAPNLEELFCYQNKFDHLDLLLLSHLEKLSAFSNALTSLDLKSVPNLKELFIHNNKFSNIDLTPCPLLRTFNGDSNKFETLDFHAQPLLQTVFINNNRIKELDFSANPELVELECSINQLQGAAMTRFIYSLPTPKEQKDIIIMEDDDSEQNVLNERLVDFLKKHNWTPRILDMGIPKIYKGTAVAENTYMVTIENSVGGKVSVKDQMLDLSQIPAGSVLSVEIAANEGYALETLTANGKDIKESKQFTVTQDTEVKATFVQNTYAVTLSPSEGGVLSIVEDIDLTKVVSGTTLTVKVSPEEGYVLETLTANGKDIKESKQFTVTQDTEVKATFVQNTYAVTLSPSEGGVLSIVEDIDLTKVVSGTTLTVKVSPEEGYVLETLTANGKDIKESKQFTVTQDTEVKATFVQNTYAVTLSPSEGGVLSIVEDVDLTKVVSGTILTVKVSPEEGYVLETLTANGKDIKESKQFTVNQNVMVAATFKKDNSLNVVEKGAISYYPNPADNFIQVEGGDSYAPLALYDLQGHKLMTSKVDDRGIGVIDVTSIPSGFYLLQVGNESFRVRILH